MKAFTVVAALSVVVAAATAAQAAVVDFSTPGTYVLSSSTVYSDGSTDSASILDIGGAHGKVVELNLFSPAGAVTNEPDASVKCLGNYGTVNQMAADGITFETYIASATGNISSTNPNPPYSYIGVDLNGNGNWDGSSGGDALIIPWDATGTLVYQQWFTNGYNGDSRVHVWQNGNNVSFGGSISIDMDTLAGQTAIDGKSWGSLDVVAVYVGAGTWNTNDFGYTAYVDNVTFTPEPATMALLVVGGIAALRRRRAAK